MGKIVGLIPLRGGSKRIPFKNIKPIAGQPLAYWVCKAAATCSSIDDVYVSTEDPTVRQVVEAFNLGIKTVERPKRLAADRATTDSVILDFMKNVDFDLLATMQATSPLLSPEDVDRAVAQLFDQGCDSLLTGVALQRFVWSRDARPLNYDFRHRPFTQDFPGSIVENGAFYLTRREILQKYRNRLGGKIGIYVMRGESAGELDAPEDWPVVERLLRKSRSFLKERSKDVDIIFSDFDGVWTDNKLYLDASGQETLRFSKEDSLGLQLFRQKSGIPIVTISKERNGIVGARCRKLDLPVLPAVDNKSAVISDELTKRRLSWSNVCYIGNDLNDLQCIERAGLSFCPSDAVLEVRSQAHYVLSHPGGHGAVREMLETLADLSADAR